YKVYYGTTSTPGTLFSTVSGTTLSVAVTSLTPGTLYYFGIKAVNSAGDSVLSNVLSATPYGVPDAPTLTAATPGIKNVVLTWTAPTNNGSSPITGYKVFFGTVSPNAQFGATLPATTLTVSVTALTDGTLYYFAVEAINVAGNSSSSNILSALVNTVPGVPTELSATAIYNQATLIWNAPSSTGGNAITHYNVYRGLSALFVIYIGSSTSTTYVDATASSGTTYHYKVSAVNGVGEGARSVAASILVPTLLPVTGKIVDASGKGIAGVTVALDTGTWVQTDAQGNFSIMASPGNHTLTVSGQGLETRNVAIIVSASGLVIGNISTTKATDYVFMIVIVVIIAALVVAVLFLWRKRQGKKKTNTGKPR
ncbi:MAG: fibronectin type III domain-containing protein, partial [Methanomassiliicoccales archaeon]